MKKFLLSAMLAFASIATVAQTPVKDMAEAEVRKIDKDANASMALRSSFFMMIPCS